MSLGLVVVNALFVFFFVSRRPAKGVTTVPMAWVLSCAGTVLPLLLRPAEAGNPWLLDLGAGLQILGLAFILTALLSLSRSFGIVPANRGIRSTGLYALVRHPLYSAEIIFIFAFVLSNPSGRNFALTAMLVGFQVLRARREERFLTEDPVYRDYRARVRYRFMPGLI
jgi:protein-S-isoprenylcysteine O-methyltransferase Ste14